MRTRFVPLAATVAGGLALALVPDGHPAGAKPEHWKAMITLFP